MVDVNPQTPAEGWCRVGYKRMDYAYDLVSGNVNEVHYQDGQWDEFHHRYRYDADNRLLEVQTSRDGILWEREARQFYYATGALARTELGRKQVQGIDHTYTLQGWLKGVNDPGLFATNDPGHDGDAGLDKVFARDAMGYGLHYHNGDYRPVGGPAATAHVPELDGDYGTAMASASLFKP